MKLSKETLRFRLLLVFCIFNTLFIYCSLPRPMHPLQMVWCVFIFLVLFYLGVRGVKLGDD